MIFLSELFVQRVDIECDCPDACFRVEYEQAISYSMFPSKAYIPNILQNSQVNQLPSEDVQQMAEYIK